MVRRVSNNLEQGDALTARSCSFHKPVFVEFCHLFDNKKQHNSSIYLHFPRAKTLMRYLRRRSSLCTLQSRQHTPAQHNFLGKRNTHMGFHSQIEDESPYCCNQKLQHQDYKRRRVKKNRVENYPRTPFEWT